MKWLLLGILFTTNSYALEAVVSVLETPLLKERRLDAPVVQYLRKGDVIKVHNALTPNTRYDHLSPGAKKIQQIKTDKEHYQEGDLDPLFTGEDADLYVADEELVPTVDRQGFRAYVLKKHLYFYFENTQELTQTRLATDPTDYRLEEPLPKKYPLYSITGYRGQILAGITQPPTESYPYKADAKMKGYSSPVDLTLAFLRQVSFDKSDRFYFGVNFHLRSYNSTFILFNGVDAREQVLRLGLGPSVAYDAIKGEKNRLNLAGSINFNLFNQINVSQQSAGVVEQRNYRALNISPRFGIQYHRKHILEDLDFILGTSLEMEPATTFQSKSAVRRSDWWDNTGDDKFRTRTSFSLAGYLGLQAAY